jgi:hypothetical protein
MLSMGALVPLEKESEIHELHWSDRPNHATGHNAAGAIWLSKRQPALHSLCGNRPQNKKNLDLRMSCPHWDARAQTIEGKRSGRHRMPATTMPEFNITACTKLQNKPFATDSKESSWQLQT